MAHISAHLGYHGNSAKIPKVMPVEQTPLELTRSRVEEIFAPFVARHIGKRDPLWVTAVHTRRKAARKKLLSRLLRSERREGTEVSREYEKRWRQVDFGCYAPEQEPTDGEPWEWGDDAMLAQSFGGARVRLLYLMRVIDWLKPKSVLEVGFGNGVNLLTLACRFPQVSFAGLELTKSGLIRAKAVQEQPQLPMALQQFSPEPPRELIAHRTIEFRQGSAAQIPFAENSFDLVFSSLALEQMERIRPQALAEFARVARRHTVMLEPFRDTNRSGFPREYILAWDYFRGSIRELKTHGLLPILVTDDMPTETWLKPCLVVCEKCADTPR